MENIYDQQIEAYLRGKMPAEEHAQFENALDGDPLLQQRTEELRQLSEGLQQVARADIRKRVEGLRDRIKEEEGSREHTNNQGSGWQPGWKIAFSVGIVTGAMIGLVLGWLFFKPSPEKADPVLPGPNSVDAVGGTIPSADPRFKTLHQAEIPGPNPGQTTSLIVSHNPALESPKQPLRKYAFFGQRGGLCVYVRDGDTFWQDSLQILQKGQQFYLKIGTNKFPIQDDEKEHDFPEKPENN